MQPIANDQTMLLAAQHLSRHDPLLAPIIKARDACPIRPHRNYYQELVDSIISQQLSVHAARAIEQRFRELFGGHFPTAEEILDTDVETLRGIGFSRAKAGYVLDLARHIVDGDVGFDDLDTMSNQAILQNLTAVKGIGDWTVHMFLMFCMGRLDILATGDLGIRNGIQQLYGLAAPPQPADISHIAEQNHWHPYESVACWYIWQSLNNTPAV